MGVAHLLVGTLFIEYQRNAFVFKSKECRGGSAKAELQKGLIQNMIKTLTSVGNSKAVILPSEMVKKYKLEKVIIEETDDGILIRSAVQNTNFQKAIEKLRKNKTALYKRIESQANDPETIKFYAKRANNFSDVDLDILEE